MRLHNKQQDTILINNRFDKFNGGVISILCYLSFFLVFADILLYIL